MSLNRETFSERLVSGAEKVGIEISSETLAILFQHQSLLERWAPKINLVGDHRADITIENHFLDSLALLRLLRDTTDAWTDIGSGAGFPGLVLAAACPQWSVDIIEPLSKKASFLQQVIAQTSLQNAAVSLKRSEELPPSSLGGVVSRAVFPPPRWLEVAGQLLRPGGWAVLMSATEPDHEAQEKADEAGLKEIRRDAFALPFSGAPRTNTLYRLDPVD